MRHEASDTDSADSACIAGVLRFWFEETEPRQWFVKDTSFDAAVGSRFGERVEQALAGHLDDWRKTIEGNLALVLLLDQMTRNVYRGLPESFSGDEKALLCSLAGVERGDHLDIPSSHAKFLLMPMMHAEDLDIQERSLPLFREYTDEMAYDYAVRHRDIIARFGRFPHRNAILGRASSPEEEAFLKTPNSSF